MAARVLLSVDEELGHLELNRPDRLNAMDGLLFADLERALDEALSRAIAPRDGLRVLVVSGRGRAFSAGTDLRELEGISAAAATELARLENRLMNAVADFPRPTVAAVQGYALGGGCELALACDLRVAADDAEFGQPEIDMGWLPAAGSTFRLPAAIGFGNALDLILTGRRIDAPEAQRLGLVQRLVPAAELLERTMDLARTLRDKDESTIGHGLRLLRQRRGQVLRAAAIEAEAATLASCVPRSQAQERIRAFLDR